MGVALNDRDVGDLVALNLMEDGAGNGGDQPERVVRASTVDNYQGEESPIILISLVRSNAQGDIGFLSSAQRVNVLLSRARNGMYIFGNMDCLTNARSSRGRDLWRRIKGLLEAKRQLLDFLPIVCSRHQTLAKVREPADFSRLSPHGGCTLPCGGELPCGHECPLPCHPGGAAVHARVRCRCPVPDVCSYGHPTQRGVRPDHGCAVQEAGAVEVPGGPPSLRAVLEGPGHPLLRLRHPGGEGGGSTGQGGGTAERYRAAGGRAGRAPRPGGGPAVRGGRRARAWTAQGRDGSPQRAAQRQSSGKGREPPPSAGSCPSSAAACSHR